MPRVFPFEGWLYDQDVAGPLANLTTRPYDVISDDHRRSYMDRSRYNVVRVDLAEGNGGFERYAAAADLLSAWVRSGVLVRTAGPASFAYEMRFTRGGRADRVRGLLCAMELAPWGEGVLPHEHVMPGPIEDRLALLRATRTQLSPVYGLVQGPIEPMDELLDRVAASPCAHAVVDEEQVEHRMWAIPPTAEIGAWLEDQTVLMADGHHRYTTALEYRNERRLVDGPGPWDRILTLLVDAGVQEVPVLPYHRVQLEGDVSHRGQVLADLAAVLAAVDDAAPSIGIVERQDGAMSYRLVRPDAQPPAVRALHEQLLPRSLPDEALRFTHDAAAADAAVRGGEAVAAYLLPATTPARIRAVVERGERLPRKSTFFWPKPRTGMVLMPLDPPANLSPPEAAPTS